MIGLKELCKKYGYGDVHFRTLLCRPEFNQFRVPASSHYVFDDSKNFHKMLAHIIKIKETANMHWTKRTILLLFMVLNIQVAWCQQYQPIIIYNQFGEPQSILKGKINYDNRTNLPTKRSMFNFCGK